jgi:nitrogen fixation/metabolism regulation signal transduction histidine kinase
MEEIDLKQKKEHIDYKGNDELGLLVRTYNQMIDDLDKSTKELAQSEREHAWREMARQIAHEIKNPLTPMRLSIQHLIRMKKTGTGNWEEKFDAVSQSLLEQIEILSNTASEFSSFAKFYVEEILPVDITEILRNQIALFDNNNESIEFIFDNKAGQVTCLARRGQITRVFVNLISNAVQAMDDITGEKIRITLSYLDSENIRISIEDSGSGVSPENLNRLFTPNFTTKTSGTGLGLAICKNIVTEIHGTIHYERSEELGGANFIITLPLIKE